MHNQRNINGQKPNYAFVDAQNVHRGISSQGWSLDWKRFRTMLREQLGVTKALLFIGHVDGNEGLYNDLKAAGFDLVFTRTVRIRKDGIETVKGNVDTDLVLRAMLEKNHFKGAVLVTGDGDFHPLAKHLKEEGKLSTILVPQTKKASKLLKEFQPQLKGMDRMRGQLERKKRTVAR